MNVWSYRKHHWNNITIILKSCVIECAMTIDMAGSDFQFLGCGIRVLPRRRPVVLVMCQYRHRPLETHVPDTGIRKGNTLNLSFFHLRFRREWFITSQKECGEGGQATSQRMSLHNTVVCVEKEKRKTKRKKKNIRSQNKTTGYDIRMYIKDGVPKKISTGIQLFMYVS